MSNYKSVNLSKNLVNELEDIAKSNNTDIDNTVKLILMENKQLKDPSFLTTTKVSKNKSTYSSVIPAPIKNKFGLEKGQVLFWDIEDNKIIIVPEVKRDDLPETPSIEAGLQMFEDMLFNKNASIYTNALDSIKYELKLPNDVKSMEDKINSLVDHYNEILSKPEDKEGFKKVVLYLLDNPLDYPDQYEILQEVYKQINTTNTK